MDLSKCLFGNVDADEHANKRLVKKIKVLSARRNHMAPEVSEKQHLVWEKPQRWSHAPL
jgi:hypothetical protein